MSNDQGYDGLRTPPQDIEAEQSVLGAMLLSKDAIADCVESMAGDDFYKPAHETIYEAVLDLYSRGEPADSVTVANYLTKTGVYNNPALFKAGGNPYGTTVTAGENGMVEDVEDAVKYQATHTVEVAQWIKNGQTQ